MAAVIFRLNSNSSSSDSQSSNSDFQHSNSIFDPEASKELQNYVVPKDLQKLRLYWAELHL